jgi:CheY-like chemotaxis protein
MPILVVEDDPDLREMMCLVLAHEGFAPQSACDGVQALERLRSCEVQPHVILLDMMMPRMDGREFLKQRACDAALRDIPIVVLSAAPPLDLDDAPAAVLLKPFDHDTLLRTVRSVC